MPRDKTADGRNAASLPMRGKTLGAYLFFGGENKGAARLALIRAQNGTQHKCEVAREMRIPRTINENVPEHFFCFGTFFELRFL